MIILVNGDSIDDGNGADFFMEIRKYRLRTKWDGNQKGEPRKELIGGGNFFRGAGPEGCGVEDDLKSRWKAFNGT